MSNNHSMIFSIIAGVVAAIIIIVFAVFYLGRYFLMPPIEIERAPNGIELDARRGELHDLAITVNNKPAVLIDTLPAGLTVVPWATFGFDNQSPPTIQQVSIVGRAGNRYFESTVSFGPKTNPQREYVSQTWRYIDHDRDSIAESSDPNQLTPAPGNQ